MLVLSRKKNESIVINNDSAESCGIDPRGTEDKAGTPSPSNFSRKDRHRCSCCPEKKMSRSSSTMTPRSRVESTPEERRTRRVRRARRTSHGKIDTDARAVQKKK